MGAKTREHFRRRALAVATVAVCGLLAGGCSQDVATGNLITIGVGIGRQGRAVEPTTFEAVLLAQQHMNQALKDIGYRDLQFRIAYRDSRSTNQGAIAAALALVQEEGAKALITSTSAETVAVNSLNYDADPANDLNVPIQCGSCNSAAINIPTATDPDPVIQATLRNSKKWQFSATTSCTMSALIIVRDLLKLGTPAADRNGDGKVKIAMYNSDEGFGNTTGKAVERFARLLQTSPPLLFEQVKHPGAIDDVNAYDWAADLEKLTNNVNETAGGVDAVPDAIVTTTFPQYHIPIIRTWKTSGFDQRVPHLAHIHGLRVQVVLDTLGSDADGQEGVSQVVLDDGLSGEVYARETQAVFQHAPYFRDSMYYDNAVTLMLAAIRASAQLANPTDVTGDQIRQALPGLADLQAAVVRTGVDELARAIPLLAAGQTINYEGASSPMDYDANQNIQSRFAHYRTQDVLSTDLSHYDCVANSDTSSLTAALAACPQLP